MKLRTSLTTLVAAFIAVMCNIHFLGSIPQSTAMGYNRVHHCSPWQCTRSGDLWNLMPRRRDVFDSFNDLFLVLQDDKQSEMSKFFQSSPQYEISEDDSKMELMLDVPGVRASDINIRLEREGRVLTISGSRSYMYQGNERQTTFQRIFTVDPKIVDIDKVKAHMADGVLIISAPKFEEQKVKQQRVIPIDTQGDGPDHDDTVLISYEEKEGNVADEGNKDELEITEEDI